MLMEKLFLVSSIITFGLPLCFAAYKSLFIKTEQSIKQQIKLLNSYKQIYTLPILLVSVGCMYLLTSSLTQHEDLLNPSGHTILSISGMIVLLTVCISRIGTHEDKITKLNKSITDETTSWYPIYALQEKQHGFYQATVLLKSPSWSGAIYGMITIFNGDIEFSQYDQLEDKFYDFEFPDPEFYMPIPELS